VSILPRSRNRINAHSGHTSTERVFHAAFSVIAMTYLYKRLAS
jgi:hypothetical protein